MHKTMASIVSLEKIEIIRSQEFMPSEARLKFWKNMIILGPKTAILGPHFWWSGGAWAPRAPPGSTSVATITKFAIMLHLSFRVMNREMMPTA